VALAVLFKLVSRGVIKKHERVVVISTAHGLKFTNFKLAYHRRELEDVVSMYANPPIELPADVSAVKDALWRKLDEVETARASGG